MSDVVIRKGVEDDCPKIRKLIIELAEYHGAPGTEMASKELEVDGFGKFCFFKTFVAEINTTTGKQIIGYTLYFFVNSLFCGRTSYIQHFFLTEKFRNLGIGELLLKALVKDALESGCKTMQFYVIDWNQPAIKFYKKYGVITPTTEDSCCLYKFESAKILDFVENNKLKSNVFSTGADSELKDPANVVVRRGDRNDCPEILRNIIERAQYSREHREVQITVEDLESDGFGDDKFYRSVVAEVESYGRKQIVGYAIYSFGYTFRGRCIFMDDVYVTEIFRRSGLETSLLKVIIQDAFESGCINICISLDNWNTQSITFFKNHGAYNWSERYGLSFYMFEEDALKLLLA